MFSLDWGKHIFQGPCLSAPSFHLYPCSYDSENFIYLADFPKELSIKYMVNSYHGEIAIVTETEEVGCLLLSPLPLCPPQSPEVSLLPLPA